MRAEVSRRHDLSGRLDERQAEPVLHTRDGHLFFARYYKLQCANKCL
jgi:hypothetical protein